MKSEIHSNRLAFYCVCLFSLFSFTFHLPTVARSPSALLAVGEVLYSALYSLSLLGTCCWLSPGHCIHLSALQCCLCSLRPSLSCSFPYSVHHLTHTHTHIHRVGKEEKKHTCTHTHTPAFIVISVLLHHDTPNHIGSNDNLIQVLLKHEQRQCDLGISAVYCVVVSKPNRFSLAVCPSLSCVALTFFSAMFATYTSVIISKKTHKIIFLRAYHIASKS